MILMLLSTIVLIYYRKKASRGTMLFAAATMLSFVVLSAGIQWNIFISRYFLPVFVISAPFISLLYDDTKFRIAVNSCAAALLVISIIVLANNQMRPLVGPKSVFMTSRLDQYFMVSPQAKPYFSYLDNMIKGQRNTNVGIRDRNGNMWEYLLWVVLKDNGVNYRIEHVDVKNNSGKIPPEDFLLYVPVIF
jgi:hypothetical protein